MSQHLNRPIRKKWKNELAIGSTIYPIRDLWQFWENANGKGLLDGMGMLLRSAIALFPINAVSGKYPQQQTK